MFLIFIIINLLKNNRLLKSNANNLLVNKLDKSFKITEFIVIIKLNQINQGRS